jgi:hypothetical protein
MSAGAVIMAILGFIILFGGTFYGLLKMKRPKKPEYKNPS